MTLSAPHALALPLHRRDGGAARMPNPSFSDTFRSCAGTCPFSHTSRISRMATLIRPHLTGMFWHRRCRIDRIGHCAAAVRSRFLSCAHHKSQTVTPRHPTPAIWNRFGTAHVGRGTVQVWRVALFIARYLYLEPSTPSDSSNPILFLIILSPSAYFLNFSF